MKRITSALVAIFCVVTLAACSNSDSRSDVQKGQKNAALTTTSVVSTCARGGVCVVGDTGPGGGTVFFVATTGFKSAAKCGSSCKYLEVAATTGTSAWTDVKADWSCDVIVAGTSGTVIGQGFTNTAALVSACPTSEIAAKIVKDYTGPKNKKDWFLPSKNELNELCKFARTQTTGDATKACDSTGTPRAGFFTGVSDLYYLSSTSGGDTVAEAEMQKSGAWDQRFYDGGLGNFGFGSYVRPIRAF